MSDEADYLFDPSSPGQDEVVRLERVFARARYTRVAPPVFASRRKNAKPYVVAAVVMLTYLFLQRWLAPPQRWDVIAAARGARIGAQPASTASKLSAGQVLVTDSLGAATLRIGNIGRVRVGPNSRVRLVATGRAEHRVSVVGRIRARVWAPPRFFVVETPSTLATDLGCVYDLSVDASGNGMLTVQSGEVELASHGVVSTVPAGASARLFASRAPGVPFLVRSPLPFREALAIYERAPSNQSLQSLLGIADSTSTISLWYLLPKVAIAERSLVYTRLNAISAAPTAVTRTDVVRLDERALNLWRRSLESNWSTEAVPLWRKAWRRISATIR